MINLFSLDTPRGSGDHENNLGSNQRDLLPICDVNGNCYKNCSRKAVHIREIETQMPWYGSNNNLIFSDQTGLATKFKSLEEMKNALKVIDYKKSVNSSYG